MRFKFGKIYFCKGVVNFSVEKYCALYTAGRVSMRRNDPGKYFYGIHRLIFENHDVIDDGYTFADERLYSKVDNKTAKKLKKVLLKYGFHVDFNSHFFLNGETDLWS